MKQISGHKRTEDVASKSLADALRFSFNILRVIMAIVVILFLTSGIFTVKQHEAGIVFRFGKVVGTLHDRVLQPGLHWAWPFPIDEHVSIPAARIHGLEITFAPAELEKTIEGEKKVSEKLSPGQDRYCLTGDTNIIHSRWLIRYRITDPLSYVNASIEPGKVLKLLAENAVVRESSAFAVDEALRTNVDELRRRVQETIVAELETTQIGLGIEGVDLKEIFPPLQVREAFNSVIMAEQERSRRVNEARAYESKVVNEVKGESARTISEAETYRTRTVERTKADSSYLESLLKQYPGEPERLLTYLNQFYEEVVGEVLAGVEERFVISKGKPGQEREVRYIIGPETK